MTTTAGTVVELRTAFVEAALECLRTPFIHQGRCLGAGMDCGGPVAYACKKLGLPIYDPKGYGPWGDGQSLEADLRRTFEVVDDDDAQAGDVILFYWRSKSIAQHVGIESTGVGRGLLHTSSLIGHVIDQEWDTRWRQRFLKRMRHPELA
ncbi:MAG: hypothetical protein DRH08_00095 [Deltaproteobacteria bacterium]|nr:MAG: hypothetical protein DRH08_00095 [Deltaproteobacteria bacterium]